MQTFVTFAIALLISTAPASAATITFSGLLTPSAFTTYTEAGFTVSATSGSWEAITSFGNPAPFIEFLREADEPEISAQIEITAGGAPFTFASADIYSSITEIPFVFAGFLNLNPVFTVTGTVPHTFGNFETVNAASVQFSDTLLITLSNPATECCPNPVGIDNIVVNTEAAPIPEPATLLLFSTGLAFVSARRSVAARRSPRNGKSDSA
jgi:hypothetical protein